MAEAKQQLRDGSVVPYTRIEQISTQQLSRPNNVFNSRQFSRPPVYDSSVCNTNQQNLRLPPRMASQPNLSLSVPTIPRNLQQPSTSHPRFANQSYLSHSPPTINPSNVLPPMLELAQVQQNDIGFGRASSAMGTVLVHLTDDAGTNQEFDQVPLNGCPVPNSEQRVQVLAAEPQQPLSPQLQPRTTGERTSGCGKPFIFYSSNLMLTTSETREKDQLDSPEIMSSNFQVDAFLKMNSHHTKDKEDEFVVEKVDSIISLDSADAEIPNSSSSELKRDFADSAEIKLEDFTFMEIECHKLSTKELFCCDFSSDGKLLASAGVENKVFIWNVDTKERSENLEKHRGPITDIRFHPNHRSSNTFATSSVDRTLKIWDATKLEKSQYSLEGRGGEVMSLDFHPIKHNVLCSCDCTGKIKYWDLVGSHTCTDTFKGATNRVRFQPQFGQYLATASENVVNVFDYNTKTCQFSFKGHKKEVRSICWHESGEYILSVSEDSARLWSVKSGKKCVHELQANGNNFYSCTFHPEHTDTWIIGGYKFLGLWNPEAEGSMLIPGHDGWVTALAKTHKNSLVASVSYDGSVKLWKETDYLYW
ncbi:transcriptional corepressor LEUNIG_HOMOLOG [Morus notabilis]|uniref:transcriptional corepressor LEUNIG_HOMOLOG n=1 Tax=Morus notabilis TaxID=981085 RepID=UPI000CECFC75|nr:transcriptional corepressor LEUNIG_HOMOLOG [Morus notabilis]